MNAAADWSALPTPSLLVDVARLEGNIAEVSSRFSAAGVSLRPHWKTSKCLEVARRQRTAGAAGFTCSTPAEVTALSEAGFTGLLWAHQPVGDAKVQFAIDAATRWGVMVIADSIEVARPLSDQAVRRGVEIDLLMDVDTGQHRTGVPAGAPAVELAIQIAALPGVRFAGVLTHEGHVGGRASRDEMLTTGREVGSLLAWTGRQIRAAGLSCDVVSVGSTPGMTTAPFEAGVTEGRPGTYVYFDQNQLRGGSCTIEQCALTVLARVLSKRVLDDQTPQVIIDAGTKAMSSDAITEVNGAGIVCDLSLNPLPGVHFAKANEEHGFVLGAVDGLAVGDLVRIVPNHACTTVNMWSALTAVHADGSTERWVIEARH